MCYIFREKLDLKASRYYKLDKVPASTYGSDTVDFFFRGSRISPKDLWIIHAAGGNDSAAALAGGRRPFLTWFGEETC